jgi:hypothetical protein
MSVPLARNDLKATRARGPVWSVASEHDAAAVRQLGQELIECASIELTRAMTGSSHADVADAARVLGSCIQNDWPAVADCSDVVLKWVTLRLHDRDSVTHGVGVDVLRKLLEVMAAKDARLESYEASFFVPALLEALGGQHSDHAVSAMKDVVLTLTKVHPASKLFSSLLQFVTAVNTNWRTRRECLELAATLVRRQGLSVVSGITHSELVVQVAVHVNDSEGAVRKSAADMLEVLEARLGAAEMLQMLHPASLRDHVAKLMVEAKHQALPQLDAAHHAAHESRSVSAVSGDPFRQWWDAVQSGDETAVVEAVKGLCTDMETLASHKDGANGTVRAIIARLWPSRPADGMRVRKYLVNGLLTVVSHRGCALKVERASVESVVRSVLNELCSQVASGAAQQNADRQAFLKALNVMMFRLLENCRPQLTCAVLVALLTESIDASAKSDYVPSKYSDLTMKCLVKLSKSLTASDPTTVEGGLLHWEQAVRAIDAFFVMHPPSVWKTRANDMPLKAVKTTLSHLCKSLGGELLALIDSCVPALETGPAVIRQYADLMIKAAGKEGAAAAKIDEALNATAAAAASAPAARVVVENADPNPSSSEYMTRLYDLRRRFGLEHVPIPAESSADAEAASEAAEKKIAELRLRLQAVRAPYESQADKPAAPIAAQPNTGAVAPAPLSVAAPAPSNDAQAQLAAIRERLAKFQAK